MKTPIIGQSSALTSTNAAANRLVNLFVEMSPEGKSSAYLRRCPGLTLLGTVGTGPIRGLHVLNGVLYVVSGLALFSVTEFNYTATSLGAVTGTGMVSMADNGTQLFVACGAKAYTYNTSTTTFAEVTDADFPGASSVGYLDGYFVFTQPNSQKVWVTELLDGTAIDPLDFASAEALPDTLYACAIIHREAWLFGPKSTEIWYNAAPSSGFPLERISGAFIEIGLVSKDAVSKLDNTLYWLGTDSSGGGAVYRAEGYAAKRVSTGAVETAIQGYETIDDAVSFAYQQDGHSFLVMSFPTEGKTWVFDVSTNLWHERAGWIDGVLSQHRATCLAVFGRVLVVGDVQSGYIYELDKDAYDDNGDTQKWIRSWRAIPIDQNNLKYSIHHSLQIDFEGGVGLNDAVQGQDPVVSLRWSDDGGHTWSNYHNRQLGKIGEYRHRVIWRRLGKSRDRIYEVSGTDPVKISIMGAELDATPCNA